jgi:hypothetical protein
MNVDRTRSDDIHCLAKMRVAVYWERHEACFVEWGETGVDYLLVRSLTQDCPFPGTFETFV